MYTHDFAETTLGGATTYTALRIHDRIKIHLVREGYLPNYPYHLISDEEMCDAFFNKNNEAMSYFHATYPRTIGNAVGEAINVVDCKGKAIAKKTPYEILEDAIEYYMNKLKTTKDDACVLPDWVYSYMLGAVISIHSDPLDIHDLITPLGVDNIDDVFTPEAAIQCYNTSKKWLKQHLINEWEHNDIGADVSKCPGCLNLRPPTMFGEPHVIKSIRLDSVSPF